MPNFLANLSLPRVITGLRHEFSDLPTSTGAKLLADGFSSYVILIGDEIVFRLAKNTEAMAGHEKEAIFLPQLAAHLPIQVPKLQWRAGPSEIFPFGVTGYQMIRGVPFTLELAPQVNLKWIAHDLAEFLRALHDFPLEKTEAYGLSAFDKFELQQNDTLSALDEHLTRGEYQKLVAWWHDFSTNSAKRTVEPRVIHGDPWCENLILNERLDKIVGVVDFEGVAIGDVVYDFVPQKYVGQAFLDQVAARYQALGGNLGYHFAKRLRWAAVLRELSGLSYALKYPEAGELEDTIQKIRRELAWAIS